MGCGIGGGFRSGPQAWHRSRLGRRQLAVLGVEHYDVMLFAFKTTLPRGAKGFGQNVLTSLSARTSGPPSGTSCSPHPCGSPRVTWSCSPPPARVGARRATPRPRAAQRRSPSSSPPTTVTATAWPTAPTRARTWRPRGLSRRRPGSGPGPGRRRRADRPRPCPTSRAPRTTAASTGIVTRSRTPGRVPDRRRQRPRRLPAAAEGHVLELVDELRAARAWSACRSRRHAGPCPVAVQGEGVQTPQCDVPAEALGREPAQVRRPQPHARARHGDRGAGDGAADAGTYTRFEIRGKRQNPRRTDRCITAAGNSLAAEQPLDGRDLVPSVCSRPAACRA